MVRGTLRDVRAEIRSLVYSDGNYAVVCDRTGPSPGTTAGQRFPGQRAAGETVELTWDYRAALRRYDPNSPYDDPLMYEVAEGLPRATGESADEYARYSAFCHGTAGALFEALSKLGYREAETAEMETCLALTEVVDDRDNSCLTLVWSLMSELDIRLSADEQRAVVETATGPFCPIPMPSPVDAALRHLEAVGFVEGYSVRPIPNAEAVGATSPDVRIDTRTDDDNSSRTWEPTFGDYALAERTGRVPTLLLVMILIWRTPGRTVRFLDGGALSNGHRRLRLRMSPKNGAGHAPGSTGLTSVEAIENCWLSNLSVSPD